MSVSEALHRPRNESEIEGAAPVCLWSFVRSPRRALSLSDDAETSSRSHSTDRNKQFARRGYGVARMSAGSRLALISLLDFARMTSLEKGKGMYERHKSIVLIILCLMKLVSEKLYFLWKVPYAGETASCILASIQSHKWDCVLLFWKLYQTCSQKRQTIHVFFFS